MFTSRNTPVQLLVNDKNFDLKIDMIDLKSYGLSDEEIEGYLEFFDQSLKEIKNDKF